VASAATSLGPDALRALRMKTYETALSTLRGAQVGVDTALEKASVKLQIGDAAALGVAAALRERNQARVNSVKLANAEQLAAMWSSGHAALRHDLTTLKAALAVITAAHTSAEGDIKAWQSNHGDSSMDEAIERSGRVLDTDAVVDSAESAGIAADALLTVSICCRMCWEDAATSIQCFMFPLPPVPFPHVHSQWTAPPLVQPDVSATVGGDADADGDGDGDVAAVGVGEPADDVDDSAAAVAAAAAAAAATAATAAAAAADAMASAVSSKRMPAHNSRYDGTLDAAPAVSRTTVYKNKRKNSKLAAEKQARDARDAIRAQTHQESLDAAHKTIVAVLGTLSAAILRMMAARTAAVDTSAGQ
jgi:hypothetical protein